MDRRPCDINPSVYLQKVKSKLQQKHSKLLSRQYELVNKIKSLERLLENRKIRSRSVSCCHCSSSHSQVPKVFSQINPPETEALPKEPSDVTTNIENTDEVQKQIQDLAEHAQLHFNATCSCPKTFNAPPLIPDNVEPSIDILKIRDETIVSGDFPEESQATEILIFSEAPESQLARRDSDQIPQLDKASNITESHESIPKASTSSETFLSSVALTESHSSFAASRTEPIAPEKVLKTQQDNTTIDSSYFEKAMESTNQIPNEVKEEDLTLKDTRSDNLDTVLSPKPTSSNLQYMDSVSHTKEECKCFDILTEEEQIKSPCVCSSKSQEIKPQRTTSGILKRRIKIKESKTKNPPGKNCKCVSLSKEEKLLSRCKCTATQVFSVRKTGSRKELTKERSLSKVKFIDEINKQNDEEDSPKECDCCEMLTDTQQQESPCICASKRLGDPVQSEPSVGAPKIVQESINTAKSFDKYSPGKKCKCSTLTAEQQVYSKCKCSARKKRVTESKYYKERVDKKEKEVEHKQKEDESQIDSGNKINEIEKENMEYKSDDSDDKRKSQGCICKSVKLTGLRITVPKIDTNEATEKQCKRHKHKQNCKCNTAKKDGVSKKPEEEKDDHSVETQHTSKEGTIPDGKSSVKSKQKLLTDEAESKESKSTSSEPFIIEFSSNVLQTQPSNVKTIYTNNNNDSLSPGDDRNIGCSCSRCNELCKNNGKLTQIEVDQMIQCQTLDTARVINKTTPNDQRVCACDQASLRNFSVQLKLENCILKAELMDMKDQLKTCLDKYLGPIAKDLQDERKKHEELKRDLLNSSVDSSKNKISCVESKNVSKVDGDLACETVLDNEDKGGDRI